MLGVPMMCELSGCNERQQGDQNEMMCRDDRQVQNEQTNCHTILVQKRDDELSEKVVH